MATPHRSTQRHGPAFLIEVNFTGLFSLIIGWVVGTQGQIPASSPLSSGRDAHLLRLRLSLTLFFTMAGQDQGKQLHNVDSISYRPDHLSEFQESHVSQWVLAQNALGLPPTTQDVTDFAMKVWTVSGQAGPIGDRWLQGFLLRNPEVQEILGKHVVHISSVSLCN